MSSEAQNAIAEAMDKHRVERWSISNTDGFRWWTHCVGCGWESESRTSNAEWEELMHADEVAHLSVEVDKALGGLTREEQWVPVEESGHRWAGRSREAAEVNLKAFSVTGICHDPEVDSPLVRIEHEARWVSGWSEA
ncbi:hypothetical protein I5H64_gp080 [Mycobacterium phage MinionDave]|uniref:Uncharacterized protein n=2 Tax=Cheoctovirus TaxID=1623281 RepID=A0A0A0RKL9_9CAUD|nr:hypothetical protein AVV73_gp084 [Mycobacterium phage CaptainTrips]YP_009959850.1 hypothetical protein I5H64_gp080 [Mycobacterium phage MinionDave]AIW02476.1 hypothetical protein PBI_CAPTAINTRIPS_84 [Mycobacterium phage CaptainTrips]QGH78865.1 hypothetical protein SEA_MINIONDAVE_80 [Mycobacterium phage MinionDave]